MNLLSLLTDSPSGGAAPCLADPSSGSPGGATLADPSGSFFSGANLVALLYTLTDPSGGPLSGAAYADVFDGTLSDAGLTDFSVALLMMLLSLTLFWWS